MRITVKSIIKWGLLAEIMTAIVGQVGEFTLRYRAYSYAFDELFGSYYPLPEAHFNNLPGNYSNETASSNWTDSTSSSELDQHYDHRLGRSYRRPATGSLPLSSPPPPIFPHQNSSVESQSRTTPASFLHSVWHNIFSGSNKPISAEQFWNESSFGPSPAHRSLDPRPILVCVTLVLLNLFFIGGILYECLALICSLTVAWLLYLILVLLILHAGTRSSSVQGQASISSSSSTSASTFGHFGNQYRHSDGVHVWATLVPSPFTILVISIILVFSLVLIAMIVEERRQIAYRIRAKSAAIPLVKSRDMDLDEI